MYPDERGVLAGKLEKIAAWIGETPLGACYALGNLANHVFNCDESLGETLRAAVDPQGLAQAIDASDGWRASEVVVLAARLRMHWQHPGRANFNSALDRRGLLRLMSRWPADVPLSHAAEIVETFVYADEGLGLDLAEALLTGAAGAIAADPVGASSELRDVLSGALRLLDVLGVYVGRKAPDARRRAIGRRYAAAFAKAGLAEAISKARKRDYQTCAMLLAFIEAVSRSTFRQVVEAIDWSAIDDAIGPDWEVGSGDAEVLLGVAHAAPAARAGIRSIVEQALKRMPSMPARLALMFPDLAIVHVEAGRTVRFDHRWEWAAAIMSHFAATRRDLFAALVGPNVAPLEEGLSRHSASSLNERLEALAILADVAPGTFDEMLGRIDTSEAEREWRAVLRGDNKSGEPRARPRARETAAFLIEKAVTRADAVGDMARRLRAAFPRASVPKPETMTPPAQYPTIGPNW